VARRKDGCTDGLKNGVWVDMMDKVYPAIIRTSYRKMQYKHVITCVFNSITLRDTAYPGDGSVHESVLIF
jgi:hypothetical protein